MSSSFAGFLNSNADIAGDALSAGRHELKDFKGGKRVRYEDVIYFKTTNIRQSALGEDAENYLVRDSLSIDEFEAWNPAEKTVKRGMDILVSLAILIFLVPLFLIVVLLIRLDSPGPAVFRQKRVGRNGREFVLYKFRSMKSGCDANVHRDYVTKLILDKESSNGENGCYKLEHDTRITRIGRVLRKTSLDELPQLVNVLKGEMSLVGPRPALAYEVDIYKPWYAGRLLAKPGMTGLWQVGGRSEKNFDEMVELDLKYIKRWSLWLDVKILLKTVRVVLKRQGAF
jgi:exopolysaccharide biosynthesis polyprenyl glycosylphosphotransferase